MLNGIVPTQRVGGMPTRAALVAPAYGLYRVAQIEYKVSPKYDTFLPAADQAGVAVGDQPVEIPKLYWKMNRYGDAPVGFTSEDMQSLGSKPIRLTIRLSRSSISLTFCSRIPVLLLLHRTEVPDR